MGKIAVTKTELVWPGKYNEDGAHPETPWGRLPFHISECLSAGKAGEAGKDGWRNKLIWGDNLLVMGVARAVRWQDQSHLYRPAVCDRSGFHVRHVHRRW